jgi:hypothetical protein
MMLADSAGGYTAASGHNLFRIAPESPDTAGNVVSYVGQYFSSIYGLFNDDFNRKSIITGNGIYSFDEDFSATLQVEFFPPESLNISHFTVDWKGQCWYFLQSTDYHYQVYRYTKGFTVLCTDSYVTRGDLWGAKFAAADDRFAVSSGYYCWETWLDLYNQDTLERSIRLFSDADSAYITCLCYIGNELQITANCFKSIFSNSRKLSADTGAFLIPGTNVFRIDRNGKITNHFQNSWNYSFFFGYHCFYRSSRETWLWDSTTYCVVTPDTMVQHDFRDGYANRFNVPCFKDSSEVQLFDEVTQRFIKIK